MWNIEVTNYSILFFFVAWSNGFTFFVCRQ